MTSIGTGSMDGGCALMMGKSARTVTQDRSILCLPHWRKVYHNGGLPESWRVKWGYRKMAGPHPSGTL
ncbi:hypothetical protein SBA4_6070016 [Candidatus Sulfopaludibacter sp. SbA4]|nr:hypothetical protein SBA4_6070016 [Candidatus Sulfopaludibacter sp. SbA4]